MANFDVALGAQFVTGEVNSLHKECLIENYKFVCYASSQLNALNFLESLK